MRLDAVEGLGLAHPSRHIGYVAIVDATFTPQTQDLRLNLGVAARGLVYAGKTVNLGLIVKLANRDRAMVRGIVN